MVTGLLASAAVARAAGPEPAGWFAGDMHVHRSCGGSPEAISGLPQKMATNDLAAISLLADMGNAEVQDATQDLPRVNGQDDPVSTAGRIVHWDAEWHWDAVYTQYPHQALGGHVVALGVTEAHQIWQEFTKPIFDWAHGAGGIAGFAHMQYLDDGIPQTLSCCGPVEYPVEVALGTADFISEDVVTANATWGGMNPDAAMRAYYRLLNTGFRPAFTAGTDYPCNSGGALGGLLTYVQVQGGQMSYRGWVDGIARGRTVVSRNGHAEFLSLVVNGIATPGDQVDLAAAGSVPVSVTWTANQSLSGTVELVSNGVVVASQAASVTASTPAALAATVSFPRSGWIVARRMGANGHVVHTGAVFVVVAGAPIRASASDARFYVSWMDNLLQKTSPGGEWNKFFPTSLAAAQARYQAARDKFVAIEAEANAANPPPALSGATLWPATAAPLVADGGPDSAVELGVRFRSDADGTIAGVRFYKSSANGGTHVASLWSSGGARLATATASNETASGWQQVDFATPVAITANTVYVASYHAPTGHYAADQNAFAAAGVDAPPLHAPRDAAGAPNGVFAYGAAGSFPNQGWNSTNYWVDVVFRPAASLVALAVAPAAATLQSGATLQLAATGTYSDGSTRDVTAQVAWTSSSPATATVSAAGVVTAANPGSATVAATLSGTAASAAVTVTPAPLAITTTSLPAATAGSPYAATLAAAGGTQPYAWSVAAGALPAGLALSASGAISGTPSAEGTASFTAEVRGAAGETAAATFSIAVAPRPTDLTIWPGTAAPVRADFSTTSTEVGVKFRSDVAGVVKGIRFYKSVANTGTHVGALWTSGGTRLATVTFTGETASGWQQALFATPVAIAANTVYVASYHATRGHYAADDGYFAAGRDAPPLHALANGVSGVNGVFRASSSTIFPNRGRSSTNFWVDVVFAPAATLTSIAVSPASASAPQGATRQFAATGTYSDGTTKDLTATAGWTSSAPAVATVSPAGLATCLGTGTTTVAAAVGAISGSATLRVDPAPLAVSTASLPAGTVGLSYAATLAATGGVAPYGWAALGALPPGVALAPSGALSGAPTAAGTFPFTAQVTDAAGATATRALSIAVTAPPALVLADQTLPEGLTGAPYSAALAASGGVPPYAWAVAAGLPPGLGLAATTGVVSGTPTAVGAYAFTVQVTDAAAQAASATASILVSKPSSYSLWPPTAAPLVADSGPDSAVELGVRFRADVAGTVTGIRFYKGAGNTGTHVGNLWSSTGTRLATATFSGESASGWQQVSFATPVAIAANTVYVASYHTNVGHYAADQSYFAVALDRAPLHAPANGTSSLNGVYAYGSGSVFPASAWNATNYWVDVVFVPSAPPPALASIAVAPASVTLALQGVQQLAATGTWSDGSTADVTRSVAWSSSSPAVAAVGAGGLVTGAGYGSAVVTAALDGVAGTSAVTVAPPAPPPPEGPGGPILIVSSSANPFSRYYAEILRAEGFATFTAIDVSQVTADTLAGREIVILGEFALTDAQAAMFTTWVNGGGHLVAMRPDARLAGLLGLAPTGQTLSEGYLLVSTAAPPGQGIVGETMQFHGTADRYTLAGATALATLYATAITPTASPAVTLRAVGAGSAAAFTYDLARSVVQTRQGNPAWSGQERDGASPIRSDDLFYGAAKGDLQPDWVDFAKIHIPQADEQQRLLSNLLVHASRGRTPLPRFWFLPSGHKAAVVMTGDDHANGGTGPRFDQYLAASPAGCSVADWQCVRGTSYVYPNAPLSSADAQRFEALGFEVALHLFTGCGDFAGFADLDAALRTQLAQFAAAYPGVPAPSTNRTHCIAFSDYDTEPKVEQAHGVRFDANYYYWPGSWVNDRPGLMTGSGLPMRFADRSGATVDVYQAMTQWTDESGQTYPKHVDALLDNALSAKGYYGVFTANMHTDAATSVGSDAIVASAKARGVPIVTARQMLTWLDGRDRSSYGALSWSGGVLGFTVSAASGARNLRGMLPVQAGGLTLLSITRGGVAVPFTVETIKGIPYAFFAASTDAYQATYR